MAGEGDGEDVDVHAVEGVDELYALDPSEFVAARDRLAKELRASGDRESAKAVKGLRRPTVVSWALNQVARQRPERIDALADAGRVVREAQGRLLAGDQDAGLHEAIAERRKIIHALAAEAVTLAGASHRDAAEASLEAASVDADARTSLRAGHLTTELERPSGFDLIDLPEATPKREPAPKGPDRREIARLEKALERADDALGKATDRLERAEKRLEDARDAVGRAQEAVDDARAERDSAAKDLERAQR